MIEPVEAAMMDGWTAARMGRSNMDCPYEYAPLRDAWVKGYHECQVYHVPSLTTHEKQAMAHPFFANQEDALLEQQILETMLAGLENHRPDLNYPESHSDLMSMIRALMTMFEIKRRPLAKQLKYKE